VTGQRRWLICRRIQDDPLHNPKRGKRAFVPRIQQHAYDPGERRQGERRKS
jgi:hypothetical protein